MQLAVGFRLAIECCQSLAVSIEHEYIGALAILAECDVYCSLRANEQVNLVAIIERPSVCGVVELALAALCRCERLMVFCIEERIGKVERVLAAVACNLNLRLYCVEANIRGDNVSGLVLLAHIVVLEPSTSLIAFLGTFHRSDVNSELADCSVFLNCLCAYC